MKIKYNSQEIIHKKPFGAVTKGEEVIFNIDIERKDNVNDVLLVICSDFKQDEYIKMEINLDGFYSCRYIADTIGLFFYYFKIELKDKVIYYGNGEDSLGGEGLISEVVPSKYQLLVYSKQYIPTWLKEGIVYQIFPDRFGRGIDWLDCQKKAVLGEEFIGAKRFVVEDWEETPYYIKNEVGDVTDWPFFGGNIKGIIDKLDYLKDMGITVIYLNPIFKALSNHKYDTWDYMEIDPTFGDENDFVQLCNKAKERGIYIILDGVFNHVGAESPFFDRFNNFTEGACKGEVSPYYDWFTFKEFPWKYESWWGIKDLPQIKKDQGDFQNYIYGVVKHWIKLGAKGFRLDVVDELRDEFVKGIRRAIKEIDKDAVLIGEVWEDASNKISYEQRKSYFIGEELDGVTNYLHREWIIDLILKRIDTYTFCRKVNSLYENYPRDNLISSFNILSSHDRKRITTVLGEAPSNILEDNKKDYKLSKDMKELAIRRFELALALQYFMPGLPTVYYGDEYFEEGYEDPYNRGTIRWDSINGSIVDRILEFSKLRKANKELIYGDFFPTAINEKLLLIRRTLNKNKESLILIINISDEDESIKLTVKERIKHINGDECKNDILLIGKLSYVILRSRTG